VVLAGLLLALQYLVLRRVGTSRGAGLLSMVVLATSGQFFTLSVVAEIDMAFGYFCTLALYLLFLALVERSAGLTLGAWLAAALAFLTKGPPMIPFFLGPLLLYAAWAGRSKHAPGTGGRRGRLIGWQLAGLILFLAVTLAWLLPLTQRVGWDALMGDVNVELFQRLAAPGHEYRGPLFYLSGLLKGFHVWVPVLVAGWFASLFSGGTSTRPADRRSLPRDFFVFNLVVSLLILLVLSFTAGKAHRYLFPAYPFIANLVLVSVLRLQQAGAEKLVHRGGVFLSAILTPTLIAAPFIRPLEQYHGTGLLCAAILLALCAAALGCASWRRKGAGALAALVLMLVVTRYSQMLIFAPQRNASLSVREVTARMDDCLPREAVLHTLEFRERWVVYYLVRDGRSVARLTPGIAASRVSANGTAHLLLNGRRERWRLDQLAELGVPARVRAFIDVGREHLLVVDVPEGSLHRLDPAERFPVGYSGRKEDGRLD
jgi:4-amino-4-deoxy-L-arabinose transferase-like glycosyltransferase